jgi:transglutaminase-like putative cysteine protease
MKSQLFLAALLIMTVQISHAAEDLKYPIAEIPDSLKLNAKIVVRNEEQIFEIKSVGKGILTISYAYTILNENGLEQAMLIVPYSQKLNRVHSIHGSIYDVTGKKVETLIQDRVVDQSLIAGYSLYEDTRVKYFRPKTLSYPFTVEYSYIIEFNGMMQIPEWDPVKYNNASIEKSVCRIICPPEITFRYLEKNLKTKASIVKSESGTLYEWKIEGVPAYITEPFSGPHENFTPIVYLAPDHFELEGYPGNMSTWSDFGNWGRLINKGRDQLTPETVALIRERTKNCSDNIEKARIIYEYMQEKTRYLNITEGIGGWQTLPAETIDRLGYGDCKALANYTMALMNAAGIKANYAWVRAGKNEVNINPSFPMNYFNHQILCIPSDKDTIWLECTNQHMPFGFIGDFTDDRKALMVTDEGGKLVNTKAYTVDENRCVRNITITPGQTGDIKLVSSTDYTGIQYSDHLALFLAGTEDKKRIILDDINIPGTEILNFNYAENKKSIPVLNEYLELGIIRYATVSGSRLLVPLIAVGRQRDVPKKVTNRKSDVMIRRPSITVDTITILIPEGFMPEAIPAEIRTESRFGKYSLKVTSENNKGLVCVRRLELFKGTHPATTYDELVNFYKKIALSDNTKVSFKRTH